MNQITKWISEKIWINLKWNHRNTWQNEWLSKLAWISWEFNNKSHVTKHLWKKKSEWILGEWNQIRQIIKLTSQQIWTNLWGMESKESCYKINHWKKSSEQIFGQLKQSQVTEWISEEIWTNLSGMELKRVKTQNESVDKSEWISGEHNEELKSMNHLTNFVFPISCILKEFRHIKHKLNYFKFLSKILTLCK